MSVKVCTHEVGDKVNEAKGSGTCSKSYMNTSWLYLETVSHWTFHLESSPILLFRKDLLRETARMIVIFDNECHLVGLKRA